MLTHLHADFVAGHRELARRYQAPLYMGRHAQAEYEHTPVHDGMELRFGSARLVFWETPGHTPGDVSTLLFDDSTSPETPLAVFSGDTLFNGDVGRPDLLASFGITKEELVEKLYVSVNRLMSLPDGVLLYPAHGAGSLCGKSLGAENHSTIGIQRQTNYAVQAKTPEEFARLVTTGQTAAPAYFALDATLNKKGTDKNLQALLEQVEAIDPLTLPDLLASAEIQFLDTRDFDAFASGHIGGFINVGLDGWFASWAGTLVQADRPIVLITEPGREEEAVTRLARVGLDSVRGFVKGGFAAARAAGLPVASYSRTNAHQLDRMLNEQAVQVIDVRTPSERETLPKIPGSLSLPLSEMTPQRLRSLLPNRKAHYLTLCAGGYRSTTAASILLANGYEHVTDLVGGLESWLNLKGLVRQN
jgi:rhodanese-related sulfurtransferase/glyoxylase-like metal-dependent hydrolase (beta-lactamase superfamily II)